MKGKEGVNMEAGKVVLVAVKASKEIPKTALAWTLTHVVQPGDSVKLIVVLPPRSSSKKAWSFSFFARDCASSNRKSLLGTGLDQRDDITESCSELLSQLHDIYDPEKIKMRVKVVSGTPCGSVAVEARKAQANWAILDKNLKHEERYCMEELRCNLVVFKKSQPKVLRLNLNGSSPQSEPELSFPFDMEASSKEFDSMCEQFDQPKGPSVTPVSSPEQDVSLTTTDIGTSSVSSSDPGTSPFFIPEICWKDKKEHSLITVENQCMSESVSDMDIEKLYTRSTRSYSSRWRYRSLGSSGELSKRFLSRSVSMTYKSMLENLSNLDQEPDEEVLNYRFNLNLSRSVREAISLSSNAPAGPPPLCSVCRHKGPACGDPPKWFTFAELEHATDRFSEENFLAEGGFGAVYRGVLPDGQVVAVKQYKLASSQGDQEFCSEVEVLSYAQHRNVVMLIGFCIEGGRRLLVYEFVCNGSLDSHLFAGSNQETLSWSARQKIAIGAARGLRYLHEECRVGCIVHRDMRPNNILLTHDFEPLVGDFGLARWQPKGDLAVETRIIGTFGYLAPEYVQTGEITDKADVYSFGVVLIELITGQKAIDITRPKGQQCLTEWARLLLETQAIDELIDKRLKNTTPDEEVYRMMQCASMCIQRDPLSRPNMSRVVRVLEGDAITNTKKQHLKL